MEYKNNLHMQLVELKTLLDSDVKNKYNRLNPFTENLFGWKEKAIKWFKKDRNITIYDSATLVGDVDIGKNSWVGPFCGLDGNGGLKIGKNCSISAGAQIISHDSVKWALSGGKVDYEYERIEIGDNCFIGTGAVIVKGVTIGDCCVVGANSVVTKNFNSNSIIAGVPGIQIGKVEFSDGMPVLKYF